MQKDTCWWYWSVRQHWLEANILTARAFIGGSCAALEIGTHMSYSIKNSQYLTLTDIVMPFDGLRHEDNNITQ